MPCPPPGELPDPGMEPLSLTSPALAGGFFRDMWDAQITLHAPPQKNLYVLFKKNFLATPHGLGILVPQPEMEPMPSAVKAQSPNHWTTR